MPCALRSASSFSWPAVSSAAAGGSAYCGCAYCCCCSCWAQRFPWRRETRFDTAVAVPAMTAVRAMPRRSPIRSFSFVRSVVGRVAQLERGEEVVLGDEAGGHELCATATKGRCERCRPPVLVDEHRARRSLLEHAAALGDVLL